MKISQRTKKNNLRLSHKRGAAVITAILFFVIISVTVAVSLASPVVNEYKTVRDFEKSKGSYYLSEAGQEDAIYRIKKLLPIDAQEMITLNGNVSTTTITTINPSKKTVASMSSVANNTRRVESTLSTGRGETFVYAMQVGTLGLFMGKEATIIGNVYSAGPICAGGIGIYDEGDVVNSRCKHTPNEDWWPYTHSHITGSVVSTGTTGSNGWIARIVNSGGNSMYAGGIANSTISGSAYCNTKYNMIPSVCNTLPSLAVQEFQLSAADITAFENAAVAGGTHSCNSWETHTITSSTTIGPKKYNCHLTIAGPSSDTPITITLQGPIWVAGNINITGKVNVRVDPSYIGQSMAIVADRPSSNYDSRILLYDGLDKKFFGAGENSWIALISKKTSSVLEENTNSAIWAGDEVEGDVILYAPDGMIQLSGDASVSQVTGKGVYLRNDATLQYESGLQDTLFYAGPSGAWTVQDWGDNEE